MLILLITLSQPVERCFVVDTYEFTGNEYAPLGTTEPHYTIGEAQSLSNHLMSKGEREGRLVAAFVYGLGCDDI